MNLIITILFFFFEFHTLILVLVYKNIIMIITKFKCFIIFYMKSEKEKSDSRDSFFFQFQVFVILQCHLKQTIKQIWICYLQHNNIEWLIIYNRVNLDFWFIQIFYSCSSKVTRVTGKVTRVTRRKINKVHHDEVLIYHWSKTNNNNIYQHVLLVSHVLVLKWK